MIAADLIARLDARVPLILVEGDTSQPVYEPMSLDSATEGSVCFCQHPNEELFKSLDSKGVALVLSTPPAFAWTGRMVVASTEHVRLAFATATGIFEPAQDPGVCPTAVVHGRVDPTATIGSFCYVGYDCYVGPGTVLHPRVTLVGNVTIGKHCIIHAGATLGADGFSYARHSNDWLEKFRHSGGLIVGHFVEIGPNTNINGGTLDPTRIKTGSKIDAMCHIGHNAQIGPHACIAAGTIMGRSEVGQAVWMGLNCTLLPGNNVGKGGTVAAHALVTKDVPDDTTVVGVPARAINRKRGPGEMW